MKVFRIHNINENKQHSSRNAESYLQSVEYENNLAKKSGREFTVKGVSYPANKYVDFKVDYLYSDGKNINWRERLVCPITGLNNRLRSSIHLLDFELTPYPDSDIYITEQVTPLFDYLKQKYKKLIGSEYLGDKVNGGEMLRGIRHEDMTKLSFGNNTFDYYLSFECFEHIPEYKKAIGEIHRVLKDNGVFMGTFPFSRNDYNNIIRARLDDKGNIVHLMEPEYHGDPVSEKGILCFTVFGWELLDEFRAVGFRDVYVILFWSDVFGYLGGEQVIFIAKK